MRAVTRKLRFSGPSNNDMDKLALTLKMAGPTGIEPATYGLRVRRSSLTEPRARLSKKKVAQENI
jgi:hypothetical protein